MGGDSSRALNAVTTAITAALGGQTDLQAATNALAPYAAQVIGQEFGHGEDKNTAAQMVAHALLGATLAYINGGDPTAGGSAAVASEAAAIYLTNQYKDKKEYQDANGEFQPNLLPENVKAQIRDLTAGIGAVIGGAAGDSSYNAQLAGVIGQNAVENNVDSYKDIQNAKAYSEQMYKDACAAYGLNGAACNAQIRKDGFEILKGTALVLLPTEPYELIPIGKGVGIVIKGSKKLIAVYKDAKAAEKAVEKAGAKIDNNFYRDGETSVDWTSAKKASNNINLAGHWQKHKDEFPTLVSQNDYYRFAQDFVTNPPKGTLVKVRKNGDSVFYQPSTNTFAVKTKDGLPRTVFKPDPKEHGYTNNLEYFHAQ